MPFEQALVIGTGMMGPGIAATLALGGVRATIAGRTAESSARGLAAARESLRRLVEFELAEEGEARRASALLSAEASQAAARQAQIVVESGPEDLA